MTVFVTGGTGFVGQAVVHQLHATGYSIRILARQPGNERVQAMVHRYQAAVQPGDIFDPVALEIGLQGADAVIHLIGIISEAGQSTFENVHSRGTQLLVTAMQKTKVRRLIHMSALGTRPRAASRYHQSKWAAEEIVRQSGLDWTIFRPSIIYGPGDQFVNLFAKMLRKSPLLPVMGKGLGKLQPIAVEIVADCFVKALAEPRSIGQTLDLCTQEILTFDEVMDQIMTVTGRKRLKCHLPIEFARGLASSLEWFFPTVLYRAPPLNRDQLIMLEEETVGNPWPAKDLFGFQASTFEEGIARYLRPALVAGVSGTGT
ncbi:MAG: complex I NDUFA9 subunit family protein [Candidatus Omnitrophica bacterium]|nr:complex I NDUFA9 subunit family protein [Candidatus Omnitrophota bacterium]